MLRISSIKVFLYQYSDYVCLQHVSALEWLLQDFSLGEHLLLVGNQGVGKNKLADRLLQLLNHPREYIQLHRSVSHEVVFKNFQWIFAKLYKVIYAIKTSEVSSQAKMCCL